MVRRGGGRARVLALLVWALALWPSGLSAQSMGDVFRILGEGGRWVGIPVTEGRGFVQTRAVSTYGLAVRGCVRVWDGHSGRWDLRATDLKGPGTLEVSVAPGEEAPFRYQLGREAQLRLEVEWSESRDTTLLVWVGVDAGDRGEPECAPNRGPGAKKPGSG